MQILTSTYSCHIPPAALEYSATTLTGFGTWEPNQLVLSPNATTAGAYLEIGGSLGAMPHLTKFWLLSRRVSQPLRIMHSMAMISWMLSVSFTSLCIILWGQKISQRQAAPTSQGEGNAGPLARRRKKAWHPGCSGGACGHEGGESMHIEYLLCLTLYGHDLTSSF